MAYVNCLTLRGIKGSALTHGELDNNYVYVKTNTGWGRSTLSYAF